MSESRTEPPGRFRIDLIAKELEAARNEGPKVSFDAAHYAAYAPVLITAFASGLLPSHTAQRHVVSAAITRAAKTPPITEATLKKAVQKETAVYLEHPKEPFVLATHLSLNPRQRRVLRLRQCTVTLTPYGLPRSFRRARSLLASEAHTRHLSWDAAPSSTGCRVRVSANNWQEGYEIADRPLRLLYGLIAVSWRASFRRLVSSRTLPLSPLWVGPTETIHTPSGKVASHTVWSTRAPRPMSSINLHESVWDTVAWVRRRLSRHPYRDRCEAALSRYAACLTEPDLALASMKLWSILETMTGKLRHDTVVRRVSFLFADSDLYQAVLHHLRENRRLLVHHGASFDSGFEDSLAGEMAEMVFTLMKFHLNRGCRLGSFSRALRFLDLPHDPSLLRGALRFMSPRTDLN